MDKVHFDKETQRWIFTDESGQSLVWSDKLNQWTLAATLADDESLFDQQQAVYTRPDVDADTPAGPVEKRMKKIKERPAKKAKVERMRKTTSVFVSGLPSDVSVETLADVFSRAGLILEGPDGRPRIKIYTDDAGKPKGEALIVYLKEESILLAETLLDGTELIPGDKNTLMSVQKAVFSDKDKASTSGSQDQAITGTPPVPNAKLQKHAQMQRLQLQDQDPQPQKNKRRARTVILEHLFAPEQLEDPAFALDVKEDVFTECEERVGPVTSIVLYDKEPAGVLTVKFRTEKHANDCVRLMDGRLFEGRRIHALIHDGRHLQKTKRNEERDDDEDDRLDKFAQWLEGDPDGGDDADKQK